MIRLVDVYKVKDPHVFLYALLDERRPEESISHRGMPTLEQHRHFVLGRPYRAWCLIENSDREYVGAVYITERNDIGIAILAAHRRKGYARAALLAMMAAHRPLPPIAAIRPGQYVANVNPENAASIALFESLGGRHISNSYELEPCPSSTAK